MSEELTPDQIKNRASDAELFYRNHFKNYLVDKEMEWLRSLGEKDWTKDPKEDAEWHQGALFCLKESKEWFEKQTRDSLARFDKEEKPKPGVVIPMIEE